MPSRTLKARSTSSRGCTAGFWPVIRPSSSAPVDDLGVLRRLAEAHVHDDLLDLRDGHDVGVAELLAERGHDVLQVAILQAAHLSTTPSHLRQMRTLRPSARTLWPMRVLAPHSGHTSCTLLAWSEASRSTMPPLTLRCGFGLVWRLDHVHAFDHHAVLLGLTFSTRPRLPRSFPVVTTTTLSLRRIGVWRRDISFSGFGYGGRLRRLAAGPDGPAAACRAARSLAQSTSGASEMIFMNFRSRSSRATGPNTRVPIGSFWSLTARPRSGRTGCSCRPPALLLPRPHDDGLDHLPLLHVAVGRASFTEAVTMSPSRA
jgi:hypothetical protein